MKKTHLALFGMLVAGLTATNVAKGEGRLVVYCSAQNVVCKKAVQGFAKNMMSKPLLSVIARAVP